MNYSYHHVVLGGTFDLLHIGHQAMLAHAFKIGQFVTIGLTTDKFNKARGKPSFQNQNERLKNLKKFLKKANYLKRCRIVLINDIFGTTLSDPKLEAIVVTKSKTKAVQLINKERAKKELKMLDIVIVPYVKDQSGRIISSTSIRDGQIGPNGKSYKKLLLKIAGKKLPANIRTKLKKPLGEIVAIRSLYQLPTTNYQLITVGDVTTHNLLKEGIKPILSIVDAKVGRNDISNEASPPVEGWGFSVFGNRLLFLPASSSPMEGRGIRRSENKVRYSVKVKNPAGQISKALILAVDQALKTLNPNPYPLNPILVSGEEDLAAIPAILLAPLRTIVLYGQPGKGLVSVEVDLKIKDYLLKLLKLN